MLASAQGADLDQIGANFSVARLVLDPGNPDAIPQVLPTYESDAEFRSRIQLSTEGYTTAGSEGSYVFHGLGAHPSVKDIQAVSPAPGEVTIYVLSRDGDGEADPSLLAAVAAVLNGQSIRPMTDHLTVLSASIVDYVINAELVMFPGPSPDVVRQAALDAATAYAQAQRRIGYDVTLSGVYAALHQPGVQRVNLATPTASIAIGEGQASHCTAITLTVAALADV
jgi:phage-related baseplate assembly protein